jgi:type IV pilus assembly protein PilC
MYVIPQIMPIIAEMTTEIPFSTRSLIAVSGFLSNNIVLIFIVLLASGFLIYGYSNTEHGRRFIDTQKLFLPVIGKVYRNYIIVQVMSTFHLLSSSGVSIVKTLRLTGASSGNRIVSELFYQISEDVSHGKKITESMQNADPTFQIFTPDILQMIESAEKTSTTHEVTRKISEQYKREVDASLAVMVKFIEPAALLLA